MNSTAKFIEPGELDSRQRFRMLFDDAPDACYLSDTSGYFVEGNRAAEILTGYKREELIGKSFLSIGMLPASELPKALTLLARNKRGKTTGPDEFSLIRKDGRKVQLEITTRPFEHDNRTLIFGIARDVSNRSHQSNEKSNGVAERIGRRCHSTDMHSQHDTKWESDLQFRQFMKQCPLPAFVRDGSGRFIFMNASAERLFKLGHSEWKNRTVFDLLPTDDAERIRRQDQSVLTRLESSESMVIFGGEKGQNHWLNRSFPLDGSNGETLVGGWALDVTGHQATEAALRDSQNRLRALLDHSRELVQSVARDGRLQFTNRAWRETLGYTEDESPNLFIGDIVEPQLRSGFEEMLSRTMDGESIADFETILLSRDGRPVTVKGNLHPYSISREIVSALGFFLDVTEEKQAKRQTADLQRAIENAAREWVRTVDAVPAAIIVVDLDARVLRLNRLATDLTGRSFKHNLGRKIGELGPGEPWQTANEMLQDAQESPPVEARRARDENAMKSWEVSLNLSTRPDSDRMFIVVARDITETVELQESLRRSELMSSLGSLVAAVAHEVRNPLFSISSVLDALEARFQDSIDFREYTDILRTDIGRLSVLMEDLIEYGKPPTLDLDVTPFANVISSAVKQTTHMAESSGVKLVRDGAEPGPQMLMDRIRLTQLLTNLIENAIQHSPSGGEVFIEAREIQKNKSAWVECKVSDSGPGFEAPVAKKIFEPFFSRRKGGTGLGMSIVHRITEEHGGEVFVGNRDRGGGVVTVRLPLLASDLRESGTDE
jgi:PAS domain S-box-containing protein